MAIMHYGFHVVVFFFFSMVMAMVFLESMASHGFPAWSRSV